MVVVVVAVVAGGGGGVVVVVVVVVAAGPWDLTYIARAASNRALWRERLVAFRVFRSRRGALGEEELSPGQAGKLRGKLMLGASQFWRKVGRAFLAVCTAP